MCAPLELLHGLRPENDFTFFNGWGKIKKGIAFSDMCHLYEIQISVSINKSSLGTQLRCVLCNVCFHSVRADLSSGDRDQTAGKA